MATLASLAPKNAQLMMRYLQNAFFLAKSSADPITTMLMTGGALAALPTGYWCVGYTNHDGTEISRDMDSDDTTSDGTLAVTRRDRTQDDKSIQVVMQETSLRTFGVYYDIDTTGAAADVNGQVKYTHSTVADQLEYRGYRLGYDSKKQMFQGIHFPRLVVTDVDSRTIGTRNNDEFNVTMSALQDDTLGTDMITFWGAPKAVLASMGVNVAAMTP